MVGGGPGSNIGIAHRSGLLLDDRYRLVAGSFARDPQRSAAMAARLGIEPERSYADYRQMAAAEAARPDGIDLAVVATPNDTHVEIAAAFLEAGIAVACEKPLAMDSAGAARLVRLAAERDIPLAVAHCYSAYAMVRHAARLVRDGGLGELRYVDVEHATGWASMAATGQAHGLRIRVFGSDASLEWCHEDPQHLVLRRASGEEVRYAQGMAGLSEDEARLNRVGLGHAEGFIEAFANYYSDLADDPVARRDGRPLPRRELSYPTGVDGLVGLQFVEAVTASSNANSAWVRPEKAGQ